MKSEKKSHYYIPEEIQALAQQCNKGMSCLENGPNCKVGATINKSVLVVNCESKDQSCNFYKGYSSSDRGLCECPVRRYFSEKYSR